MSGRLSVCMIVKDEADVLPRCLASLEGFADEIVALDTGSTDESKTLLERAGAHVFEQPWEDDFSKARNAALRHASGDWVLFIDADEALDPETKSNIRVLMVDVDLPISYEVPIQSFTSDDESAAQSAMSWMPRMFNQPANHVYAGRIHESLFGSLPIRLDASTFKLLHWGYQPSRVAAKQKHSRNDMLLDKERLSEGDSVRTHFYTALNAKSPEEARESAEKALAALDPSWSGPTVITMAAAIILNAMLKIADGAAAAIERSKALQEAHPMLGGEATFLALTAEAHKQNDDKETALTLLQEAFEAVTTYAATQSYSTDIVPANVAARLAETLTEAGQPDRALAVLQQAVVLPRLGKAGRANLQAEIACLLIGKGDLQQAAEHRDAALAVKPGLRTGIANAYLNGGHALLALQTMAPILDGIALRDRLAMLSSNLVGDPQGLELLHWYLAANPDNELQVQLGLHLLAKGEQELAQEAIAKGLGVPANSVQVFLQLAHFEQTLGRPDDAEQRLVSIVQYAAETEREDWLAEALIQWGNLAFQRQQFDKAVDLFQEAQNLRPQDPYLHFALGSALSAQGTAADGRAQLERALLIDPTYAPAHRGLDAIEAAGDPAGDAPPVA